jgi:hypothetical protein
MHMGIEPGALPVVASNQMHAAFRSAAVVTQRADWRFDDSHWRHPVMPTTYNESPGKENSAGKIPE